jgi:hypothetical protein
MKYQLRINSMKNILLPKKALLYKLQSRRSFGMRNRHLMAKKKKTLLMLGLHGDTLEIRLRLRDLHCSSIGTVYTTTDFEL